MSRHLVGGAVTVLGLTALCASADGGVTVPLARPSAVQYRWQEQERVMFVCLDPCTWQGNEYDDHSTPLDRINPERLDTDQWCRAAKLWGARQILFVAKHTGGFCWWQTETSSYGIKETPWRGGKGDVLRELSDSCRRHGLRLGVYVYPGDDTWGAYMGGGGRTRDPEKQEAYSRVFRQQLTEVLTRYGEMTEVWFDGSCIIPVGDILAEHAREAVIFQGPQATLRWVGNEAGIAPYPAWNAVRAADAATGVATAQHGDPDGEVWMPLECDTTLYDHFWFWAEAKMAHRKSLEQLMEVYYGSVGRGAVLLLNSTPDTSGRIPDDDLALYAAFGAEIERRFGRSLAETHGRGSTVEIAFTRPTEVNHAVTMEDYREGERIRGYAIEGWADGRWQTLAEGTSVGRKRIDSFPPVTVGKVRLRVTESAATPLIRRFAVFDVRGAVPGADAATEGAEETAAAWDAATVGTGWQTWDVDLSAYVRRAGQYEVRFRQTSGTGRLEFGEAVAVLEGVETPGFATALPEAGAYAVNRTAVPAGDKGSTVLRVRLQRVGDCAGDVVVRERR